MSGETDHDHDDDDDDLVSRKVCELEDFLQNKSSSAMEARCEDLKLLSHKLLLLKNLGSLSLKVHCEWDSVMFPTLILTELVTRLPKSCVNLELEITIPDGNEPETHLCSAIFSILPRLKHLSLRLPHLCCALFGGDKSVHTAAAKSQPVFFKDLDSLLISCDLSNLCLLESQVYSGSGPDHIQAAVPLAIFLSCLYSADPQAFPSARQIMVLDEHSRSLGWDSGEWRSIVIRDIIARMTRQMPLTTLAGSRIESSDKPGYYEPLQWMTRIASHPAHDIIGTGEAMQDAAEGNTWVTLYDGTRVPAAMLSESETQMDIVRHRLISRFQWRDERGGIEETQGMNVRNLWRYEDASGVECLSDNLIQQGVEHYTAVMTIMPYGWKIDSSGRLSRLQKEDGS